VKVHVGAATDVGRARERNEDSLLAAPPLYAVADGMGGHRGGNVASQLALTVLARLGDGSWDRLADQVREANRAILERSRGDRSLSGMGTTITAAFMEGDDVHLAHVGDSRAYLFRDGELHRLTEDHTLVHRMALEGKITEAEEENHPQRSILIRALGVEDPVEVDEVPVRVVPGDRVLLCSDGLHSMVGEEEIEEIFRTASDPQEAAERLVESANRAGGLDNVTVVVLDFEAGEGVELADRAIRDSVIADEPSGPDGTGTREAAGPEPSAATADGAPAADLTQVRATPGGRPDDTVAMQTPVGTMTEPRPEPTPVPPQGTYARSARRRRRRRLAIWLASLVVLLATAFVGLRLYLDQQWFVGVEGGHVAVFRGIPSELVGIKLYGLVQDTGLDAPTVEQLRLPWRDLPEGITADSRGKAEEIVANMRSELLKRSLGGGAGKSTTG